MKTSGFGMAIFDLDGVIVDTAKYHYIAWKELADRLGFTFTHEHNERLKGVSRMRSLDILLEVGGLDFPQAEKEAMAAEKNRRYVEHVSKLGADEILPGAEGLLAWLRGRGVRTGLGSASKNAMLILDGLGITGLFDIIVDGNLAKKAKPDPEVFLLGARGLCVPPAECVVFEDAQAGIEAAAAAGMAAVGVGPEGSLGGAFMYVRDLSDGRLPGLF